MPDSGPLFIAGLIFSALAFAAAVGLVAAEKLRKWQPPSPAVTASLVVYGSALLGTVLLGGQGWKLAVPVALGWATSVAAHRVLRDFTVAGRLVGVIKWWLIAVDDQGAVDVGRRHLTDRLRRLGLYVLQDRDRYVMR